jgi:hypothetical protein
LRKYEEVPFTGKQNVPPDLVLDLAPEAQRAYDAVVRPNAILPIPRYLLEQWLPLLGASRAWLVLAFRQVAFVSRSGSDEVPVRTTLRKLGRWCGLSHVRIHQVLKDAGYLTWFVRNPHGDLADRNLPRSQPTTFMVRSDIPLTPQDQARLTNWLEQRSPSDDKDWILALEEATEAKKLRLPEDTPLPQVSLTIQQLVYAQRGESTPLPPGLDQACTELHARWVQPDRVTLATHYFLIRWLPDLSPGLGWLVMLLRSRSYQQKDEHVGQVWISGGWHHLADTLGVSRRSLTRWVSSPDAQLFFQRRDDVQDPTDRRNLLLAVRLSEPIHPFDQEEYLARLEGQSLTNPISVDRQFLTSTSYNEGHSLTSCGESSTDQRNNLTSPGQDLPDQTQSLTRAVPEINNAGTKFNTLRSLSSYVYFNNSQNNHQPQDRAGDQIKTSVVALFKQWQMEEILSRSGINKETSERVLNAMPHEQLSFIGWILFALSIQRIEYPVLFALKRNRETSPPAAFLKLAYTPVKQCYAWLTGMDSDFPPDLEKTVMDLRRQRAHEKLFEIGALPSGLWDSVSWVHNEEDEGGGSKVAEGGGTETATPIRSNGMTADQVWDAAQGQLQAELERTVFDTWVRDVEYLGYEGGSIKLGVANEYAKDWLEDRLTSTVERVLTSIIGKPTGVKFVMLYEVDHPP